MWVEVVLSVALLLLLWQALKKPVGLPPGRWGLPLIGYIPLSFKSFEDHLMDLHKQHGDVYLWRIGTQTLVFLHDQKMIREAFSSPDFIDRPNIQILNINEKVGRGVVGSNGLLWQFNRRFALRQLRDMGMGKSKIVSAVHKQAALVVEEFKKQTDTPTPVTYALNVAIVNIVWQMIGDIQFDYNDPRLMEFQKIIHEVMDSMKKLSILDLFTWINTVLPSSFVSWLFHQDILETAKDKFFAYFKEVVDEHRATLDRDKPRDLIDGYLIEMEKDDPDSVCSEMDLYFLIFDLFNAGSLTTRDTIIWMIFYLANHPHVQKKMQLEIDQVLPRGTLPTLEDKTRMPYTEAVVHELLRISSFAALGAQHTVTRDTQLGGYIIPKGAIVSNVIFDIHMNTKHWDNPETFLPERWINQDGKFSPKKEGFMPFGTGKRQCVGEGLARLEVFMFTVALFQAFTFSPPSGKLMDLHPDPGNPIGHSPKYKQDVVATLRL